MTARQDLIASFKLISKHQAFQGAEWSKVMFRINQLTNDELVQFNEYCFDRIVAWSTAPSFA